MMKANRWGSSPSLQITSLTLVNLTSAQWKRSHKILSSPAQGERKCPWSREKDDLLALQHTVLKPSASESLGVGAVRARWPATERALLPQTRLRSYCSPSCLSK